MTTFIARDGHSFNGALIGSLLGDGNLYRSSPTANTCYTEGHSLDKKDYLTWKREYMRPYLSGGEISERSRLDPRTEKVYYRCDWWSNVHKRLNYHHDDFYPNGKKIAKTSVLNRLTPLGLAIWFMDDGHLQVRDGKLKAINLATNGFDDRSRQNIIDWFDKMLGMKFLPCKGGEIETYGRGAWRFLGIVKPFVDQIESMKYKADLDRVAKGTIYKNLPEIVLDRLTEKDTRLIDRGYVWQHFPKEKLFPFNKCLRCGTEFRKDYDTAYCSNTCRHRYHDTDKRKVIIKTESS